MTTYFPTRLKHLVIFSLQFRIKPCMLFQSALPSPPFHSWKIPYPTFNFNKTTIPNYVRARGPPIRHNQILWKYLENLRQALHWSLTSEHWKVALLHRSFGFPTVITTIFVSVCIQWEIVAAVFNFKPQHRQRQEINKLDLHWVPRIPYNWR